MAAQAWPQVRAVLNARYSCVVGLFLIIFGGTAIHDSWKAQQQINELEDDDD